MKPLVMKNKKKSIFALIIALSAISMSSKSSELPLPEKKIEKITINVNGKTHIVWVNKTMIDMVKNSDTSEHQSSSVIFPAGYTGSSFSSKWYNYMLNRTKNIGSSSSDKE